MTVGAFCGGRWCGVLCWRLSNYCSYFVFSLRTGAKFAGTKGENEVGTVLRRQHNTPHHKCYYNCARKVHFFAKTAIQPCRIFRKWFGGPRNLHIFKKITKKRAVQGIFAVRRIRKIFSSKKFRSEKFLDLAAQNFSKIKIALFQKISKNFRSERQKRKSWLSTFSFYFSKFFKKSRELVALFGPNFSADRIFAKIESYEKCDQKFFAFSSKNKNRLEKSGRGCIFRGFLIFPKMCSEKVKSWKRHFFDDQKLQKWAKSWFRDFFDFRTPLQTLNCTIFSLFQKSHFLISRFFDVLAKFFLVKNATFSWKFGPVCDRKYKFAIFPVANRPTSAREKRKCAEKSRELVAFSDRTVTKSGEADLRPRRGGLRPEIGEIFCERL